MKMRPFQMKGETDMLNTEFEKKKAKKDKRHLIAYAMKRRRYNKVTSENPANNRKSLKGSC